MAGQSTDPDIVQEGITTVTSAEQQVENALTVPSIKPDDYLSDPFLRNIYLFLTQNMLTGSDIEDRTTLLLADDFFTDESGILYRLSLPMGKKNKRVHTTEIRLALPQKYLAEVIQQVHDLGHFSKERNFEFLRTRFYAKNLFDAISRYVKSCSKCQRYKPFRGKTVDMLHPLSVPSQPNEAWSTDHLILSRPTKEGYTAIIVFIDLFSHWPVIRLVKNTSAICAAEAFLEGVIATFGLNPNGQLILHSDKGAAYTSTFFREVCKLLNVRLITSASQISQSNGLAESCVKNVKQGLKIFAESDKLLKQAIPMIELSLRSQPNTATQISPFKCVMGREMCLPIIKNDPTHARLNFKGDQLAYFNFIHQRLQEIHEGVRLNLEESKTKDQQQYNKRHKAVENPPWHIGQEVLISDRKIKPHSDHILTRPNYHGSFLITDIIQNPGFGPSYRLTRTSDGRPLRYLISGSRLRPYTAPMRADFHVKYPPLFEATSPNVSPDQHAETSMPFKNQTETEITKETPTDQQADNNMAQPYAPAIKILKQRKKQGKTEFLVLFETNEQCWCDKVSPALLKHFRLMQEQSRKKRRKRRN
jgi:hypothetical protein